MIQQPEPIGPAAVQLVADLAAANVKIQSVDGVSLLVMPQNYKHIDLTSTFEKSRPVPDRKRGTATLQSIDSLIAYAKDQAATETGYAYADVDARTIAIVFNDFKGTGPTRPKGASLTGADGAGWRDHRATFNAELTPEAALWIGKSGKHNVFGQMEFAEFIEDNIADLQGEAAKNLLTVATTIAATTGINFASAKRLQDGQTQLVYNEVINTTAGADGKLQIPQTFDLGLRLFKGDQSGYRLTARLKYRINSGAVKFWYELERPERALEDAFKGYVAKVAEAGYTVLLGKPGA